MAEDLAPTARPPKVADLRRLIGVMVALTGTFDAVVAAIWAVTGDGDMGRSALTLAAAVLVLGLAALLLSRGRLHAAVTVLTVGLLVTAIVYATVPPATPALAAIPLLGGSIALQYVSGRTLRRLLWLSWLASVLIAVIVEVVPAGGPLPGWGYPFMRVMSFAAIIGTTLILVQQFGGRLQASLAESKDAEEALRASARSLEEAQRVARVGSWGLDVATGTITWSEEMHRMLGHDPATRPPTSNEERAALYVPESWTRLSGVIEQTVRSGTPFEVDLEMVRLGGTRFWATARGEPERDATGAITGLRGTVLDIDGRRAAEQEVRRLNAELEARVVARTTELTAANAALESFSYSVSHDLRQPLRAVTGFAEIIEREYRDRLDERGAHLLDNIVAAGRNMGVLIEGLLAYSRLGRAQVRVEPVPLAPILAELRTMFGDRIAAAGATLELVEPLVAPGPTRSC